MDRLIWLLLALAVIFNVGILTAAMRVRMPHRADMCSDIARSDGLHTCVVPDYESHSLHRCMCGFSWVASRR